MLEHFAGSSTRFAMMTIGVGLPDVVLERAGGEDMDGRFPYPLMAPLMWPKRGCDFAPNVAKLRMFFEYFSRLEMESAAEGAGAGAAVAPPTGPRRTRLRR